MCYIVGNKGIVNKKSNHKTFRYPIKCITNILHRINLNLS